MHKCYKLFLLNFIILVFFSIQAFGQTKKTLSVLCPQGLLSYQLVSEFEKKNPNINIRVEFAITPNDFEQRLRAGPLGAWDLVIADENHLVSLAISRLIRPFSANKKTLFSLNSKNPLEHLSAYNAEGSAYISLMADPLGIIWLDETRNNPNPIDWHWLVDPKQNPLWRGRIYFPENLRFQLRIARLAVDAKSLDENEQKQKEIANWLKKVWVQSHHKNSSGYWDLLAEKRVAGVLWLSEYQKIHKIIPKLLFEIPQRGTIFERYGIAIVNDTLKEELATTFAEFLVNNRNQLAQFVNLVSLETLSYNNQSTMLWKLFEDNEAIPKSLNSEIEKVENSF